MSLQSKFAVVFVLLGLTVLGSLSAAIWTFFIQHRALTGPFESTPRVLDSLQAIRQSLDSQSAALRCLDDPVQFMDDPSVAEAGTPVDPTDRQEVLRLAEQVFAAHSSQTARHLNLLTQSDLYLAGGSQSALRVPDSRLREFDREASKWFHEHDDAAKETLLQTARDTNGMIVRIERRLLEDRGRGIDFSNRIVWKLLGALVYAALASVLLGVLAVMLVRRWVVRPVQSLRVAASHIAQGHFEHQIPVRGADELAELSKEVNSMASMVKRMLEERVDRERLAAIGEMVRRLAHNLRNPLAGIRGVAELTRDELPPGSELIENQTRILMAVDRLEQWMSDLLSATKPLQIHPQPTDPKALLESVLGSHRAMAFTKGITLESDIQGSPAHVVLDPVHIEHALVSILSNGIQAAPAGTRIRLSSGLSARPGYWEVRVADQGPGVPPELIVKVFQPYFTTKRDGNGIGLAVALQIVKGHGGQITIEPGLGSGKITGSGPGATFVVTLPITSVASPTDVQPTATPSIPGVTLAQDSGHRGRGEPAVLNPSNAE